MYLLANAFRTDQQKPPDRLPTVKAARAFFKEVDVIQKSIQKSPWNFLADHWAEDDRGKDAAKTGDRRVKF